MSHPIHTPRRRTLALGLALAALAAVVAPTAVAHRSEPLRQTNDVALGIYDAYLSQACAVDVDADLAGTEERRVFVGEAPSSPAREITSFDGTITWRARGSGKTYSDRLQSTLHISYPEGVQLWAPARVTVVGRNGGTFPIGGGPAGIGVLVYNATVYAADQGFPYWFVEGFAGDPVTKLGTFDWTTRWICARLA